MSKDRIRRNIQSKIGQLIYQLTTEELEFLLDDRYVQSPDMLLYMELLLTPLTTTMRQRCKLWDHKLDFSKVSHPTLFRLANYRRIHETWDDREPFPGRGIKPLHYYLDVKKTS